VRTKYLVKQTSVVHLKMIWKHIRVIASGYQGLALAVNGAV